MFFKILLSDLFQTIRYPLTVTVLVIGVPLKRLDELSQVLKFI